MEAIVVRPDPGCEYPTDERCSILESWNRPDDPVVSIARARVAPGESTRPHRVIYRVCTPRFTPDCYESLD